MCMLYLLEYPPLLHSCILCSIFVLLCQSCSFCFSVLEASIDIFSGIIYSTMSILIISSSKVKWSCSVVSYSLWPCGLQPTRLSCPRDSPGKKTGVGCHFLLQGIFPTQWSNPGLPHYSQTLYPLSYQGCQSSSKTSLIYVTVFFISSISFWFFLTISISYLHCPSVFACCLFYPVLWIKFQYFGHLMRGANSLEKVLLLGQFEGRRSGQKGRDGWMASPTQ